MLGLHPDACCEMGHHMLTLYPTLATKVTSEQCKLVQAACASQLHTDRHKQFTVVSVFSI